MSHDTFLFVTPMLILLDPDGRRVVRLTASLWSRVCDTVQPLGTRWTRPSAPSLAALVGCGGFGRPVGKWVQGGVLALGCQWREGGWCMPTLFLSPMPLWCCGLRCPWGLRTAAAACLLGVCDRSGYPHSGAARVGGSSASAVAPVAG
jgi:hypothetical protein